MTNKITKLMLNGEEYQIREYQAGWQPGANTIAYWKLDGDMLDYSGNGYDGTGWTESYTTLSSGIQVASFNGQGKITTGYTSDLVSPFTVSAWYKRGNTSAEQYFLAKGTETNGKYLHMGFYSDNRTVYDFYGSTNPDKYITDTTNWHHALLTFDGTTRVCYLDGIQIGSYAQTSTGMPNAMYLGGRHTSSHRFNGNLSNVIVEDKVWSAQEVSDYYNETKSLYEPQGWQPGVNTVAYYPFDSTNTVNDLSSNGYDLTNFSVVFGTYQGVDCAFLSRDEYKPGLYYSQGTQIIPTGDFTWSCWIYLITLDGNYRVCGSWAGYPYGILGEGTKLVVYSSTTSYGITAQTGGWHLYTITGNFSQGTYSGYIDGVLSNTWSGSGIVPDTGLCIGGLDQESSATSTANKLNGYLSNYILENKIWTVQEVSNYFNQTKSLYGIS